MSKLKTTSEVADAKPTPAKPFIEVIEKPSLDRNVLAVLNKNPMYAYQWVPKIEMAGNRYGHWITLDKTHPDFKGIRVEVDHSPDQTYISLGDLILCCCRKETFVAWEKAVNEQASGSDEKVDKQFEKDIEEERSMLTRKKDLKVL